MITIKTPNAAFTGIRHGVAIVDGVGHTGDPVAAEQCESLGYVIEEAPKPKVAPKDESKKDDSKK